MYEMYDQTKTGLLRARYDVLPAFSLTKCLEFRPGDDGNKRFFRQVHPALLPGGVSVLELHPLKSYKATRRKGAIEQLMTPNSVKLNPEDFGKYVLEGGASRACGRPAMCRRRIRSLARGRRLRS